MLKFGSLGAIQSQLGQNTLSIYETVEQYALQTSKEEIVELSDLSPLSDTVKRKI